MSRQISKLLPASQRAIEQLGLSLALARRRRQVTAEQMAERAGMSRSTLRNLEAGDASVTMGAYVAVMQVLGMASELAKVCTEDQVGRDLQDAKLLKSGRVRRSR
jgi:transcriptional regulator with XRE-family HTH domain